MTTYLNTVEPHSNVEGAKFPWLSPRVDGGLNSGERMYKAMKPCKSWDKLPISTGQQFDWIFRNLSNPVIQMVFPLLYLFLEEHLG